MKYERKNRTGSMRRLILCAMLICVALFLVIGLIGFSSLSQSYYAEFARNQNELLESYYHYIGKCMEDATRFSLSIIADESVQQGLREIMDASGARLAQKRTTLHKSIAASVAEVSTYGISRA